LRWFLMLALFMACDTAPVEEAGPLRIQAVWASETPLSEDPNLDLHWISEKDSVWAQWSPQDCWEVNPCPFWKEQLLLEGYPEEGEYEVGLYYNLVSTGPWTGSEPSDPVTVGLTASVGESVVFNTTLPPISRGQWQCVTHVIVGPGVRFTPCP
jgi:hypothetical protein